MFCTKCGNPVSATSNFCSKCGHSAAANLNEQEIKSNVNESFDGTTFKKTRVLNWLVAAFLFVGFAIMVLGSPSAYGLLLLIPFSVFFVGTPLLSAIALGNSDFSMFGVYIAIDPLRRTKLRKISFVLNWITLVFGIGGMLMCIWTQQYGPMIPFVFYVLPPALTIRAIKLLSS